MEGEDAEPRPRIAPAADMKEPSDDSNGDLERTEDDAEDVGVFAAAAADDDEKDEKVDGVEMEAGGLIRRPLVVPRPVLVSRRGVMAEETYSGCAAVPLPPLGLVFADPVWPVLEGLELLGFGAAAAAAAACCC